MKTEQQRIIIATKCGYACAFNNADVFLKCGKPYDLEQLPDYLNDLNAMRTASVEILTSKETAEYVNHIRRIIERDDGFTTGESEWALIDSTAAQRAEAFLRTLNLWTE